MYLGMRAFVVKILRTCIVSASFLYVQIIIITTTVENWSK